MENKTFGIWSEANQEFLSKGHDTSGDALIEMLLLASGQPAHDEKAALADLSVREETPDGPGPSLSEFVGEVMDALVQK